MKKHFILSLFLGITSTIYGQIIRVDNYYSTDTSRYQFDIKGEFQTLKNTSEFYNITAGSQFIYHGENARISSINNYKYIFGNNEKIANSGYQHLRIQRHVSKNFDVEAFGQIQANPVLKIQHRSIFGTGLRFDLRKEKKVGLISGLSIMYEHEKQKDTAFINNDLRTNIYIILKTPIAKNIKWYSIAYYQFIPNQIDDYRVSLNTTIDFNISEKLTIYLAADLAYDSNPFAGVINLTYITLNGIKYNF